MREAAAHKKRLRKEAKSGLGRLDHDDQTVIADLPRDGREECHGSNNVGGKGKETYRFSSPPPARFGHYESWW